MRPPSVRLSLIMILAMLPATALAQRTTVTVDRGKVRAETKSGAVTVSAGQKAILTAGAQPVSAVDDPLVQDVIRMTAWIAAERNAKRLRIDYTSIQSASIESETLFRGATFLEMPNKTDAPATNCTVGNVSGLRDGRLYDLQGNLLTFEWKQDAHDNGPMFVQFPSAVDPGRDFQFVMVGNTVPPKMCFWQEGKVWHAWRANDTPYCLNYFRWVLPKGAILLATTVPPVEMDEVGGRPAVTLRNYTGKNAEGEEEIAFLWPEKDGSTLEDVPPQYRGLRDARDQQLADEFRTQVAAILAGGDYNEQSTPLGALLTVVAATKHKDKNRLAETYHIPGDTDGSLFKTKLARMNDSWGNWRTTHDLLTTALWPQNPQEGDIHAIEFCRLGTLFREYTAVTIYHEGRWCLAGEIGGPCIPDVSRFKPVVRDARNQQLAAEYEARMTEIAAGKDYNDQSTPFTAFLTFKSAVARQDKDRLIALFYSASEETRAAVRKEMEGLDAKQWEKFKAKSLDAASFLSTKPWPEQPKEGDVHRIHTCQKGSLYDKGVMTAVYHDGKWYMASLG